MSFLQTVCLVAGLLFLLLLLVERFVFPEKWFPAISDSSLPGKPTTWVLCMVFGGNLWYLTEDGLWTRNGTLAEEFDSFEIAHEYGRRCLNNEGYFCPPEDMD